MNQDPSDQDQEAAKNPAHRTRKIKYCCVLLCFVGHRMNETTTTTTTPRPARYVIAGSAPTRERAHKAFELRVPDRKQRLDSALVSLPTTLLALDGAYDEAKKAPI
eukprot:scaffold896_cov172-Amphora_coffeaeformis.AAC.19